MSFRPFGVIAVSISSLLLVPAVALGQSLNLAGLRQVDAGVSSSSASFTAVQLDSAKSIYLLEDENDGVRVLKLNPAGTTVLASAHLGAAGDHGTAMALDSSANVYVAGTAGSGQLAAAGGGAVAFPAAQSGFVAGFNSGLAQTFITSTGGSLSAATWIYATGGSVFVTGTIQTNTLPVTGNAVVFSFPPNTTTTGFVEQFNSAGTTLGFASYLGGPNGNTLPAAIVADSSGNMIVTGADTATGFPTINAIQPELVGTSDLFLTKLSASAGLQWSTLLGSAGGNVAGTSLALASSGAVSVGVNASTLGLPLTQTLEPVPSATNWALVMAFSSDGQTLTQSTALGDGSVRAIALDAAGDTVATGAINNPAAWPLTIDLQHTGTAFVTAVSARGALLYSTRVGGMEAYASNTAQSRTTGNGIAVASDGTIAVAGNWLALGATSGWLPGALDLPMVNAPNAALPGTLASTTSTTACQNASTACAAAYLAVLSSATAAELSLSVDTVPNLAVRNVGGSPTTISSVSATGYATATDCINVSLAPGAACNVQLTGNGPGTVTLQSSAGSFSYPVTGAALSADQNAVQVEPREIVFPAFGAAPVATQTVTASNLTAQSQVLEPSGTSQNAFSLLDGSCTGNGESNDAYVLPGNSTCTLAATYNDGSTQPSEDGAEQGFVTVQISGEPTNAVSLYGYKLDEDHPGSGALGLTVSATTIDFGTNYIGGTHAARSIVIANATASPVNLPFVASPASDPNFTVTDLCPVTLAAYGSCVIQVTYASAYTATDAATLALPGGGTLELTGSTLQQPGAGGLTVNSSVTVTPLSLTFGAVGVGDAATTQAVTISNSSNSPIAISLATTSQFSQTNNCGGVAPANGSCVVQVAFTPTALGVVHGQLSVTPSGSSPVDVALTGGGTNTLNFGTVTVGEQATQWVPLGSFVGNVTATVEGPYQTAVVNGYSYNAPPTIVFATSSTGSCTTNCYIGVRAVPSASGTQSGTLTVAEQNGATTTYPLTAASLLQSAAVLSATNLNFGTVSEGSASAPQYVDITNSGNAAIALGSATATAGFSVTGSCGSSLAGGASCVLAVTFAPTTIGTVNGTLSITAGGSTLTASLSGNGANNPADLGFSPASVTFASPAGAISQTVTITNHGATPVTLSGIMTPGGAFYSVSSTCGTLQPNNTCTVQLSASSVPAGTDTTVALPFTATVGSQSYGYLIEVTATPTGLGSGSLSLQVSPTALSFSTQTVGQASNPEYLTLTNNASSAQAVSVIAPAQFSVDTTQCATLAAGASCSVPVRFLPYSAGVVNGTVTLQATGVPLRVTVTGFGVPVTKLAAPAYPPLEQPITVSSNPQGDGFTSLMTITNAGTQPLVISGISGANLITGNACTAPVAAGASCNVTVATTVNDGCGNGCTDYTTTEQVTVLSNAESSPDLYDITQTHSGENGETALPGFQLTATSLTFAQLATGQTASKTFQLQSIGTGPVTVAFSTTGDFTEHDNCGGTLIGYQGGGTYPYCTITVTFSPTASGFRAGTLQVATTAGLQTITLAGNGPTPSGPVATSTTLGASATSVPQGQSVTFTAHVTPASGTGTPTGTVTFSSQGVTFATVNLQSGSASYSASTASLGPANYPVNAKYNGDANDSASTSGTVTVTVTATQHATTTTLHANPTTVSAGSSVTLTAAVARSGATGSPTGTVQFYSGSTLLGSTTLTNGSCTFTLSTSGLTAGSYAVVANYLGDSVDQASSSTAVTITVQTGVAATRTTLTATPSSVAQGGAVTLRATVVETAGSATPTGNVTFYYGTTVLGSAPLNNGAGQIVTTTSSVPPGTYGLTAVYGGDGANSGSTSAVFDVTVQAPTHVTLSATPTGVTAGQTITLTSTVTETSGSGTPGGSVRFTANGMTLGSATVLNGTATYSASTTGVPAGSYSVVANYLGDRCGRNLNFDAGNCNYPLML